MKDEFCACPKTVGFVSTRLAGMDGVSMETAKWADVFEGLGFACFYFAGELDRPDKQSYLAELAHFNHPEIRSIFQSCFGKLVRERKVTNQIQKIKESLKEQLYEFIDRFKIDLLIPQNALAIPMKIGRAHV